MFIHSIQSITAILNGFREFKKYVTINIIASFVGLSFTLLLVFFFSIKGALIAAISFQSITFFVSLFFVLKSPWFKKTFVFSRFNYFFAKKIVWLLYDDACNGFYSSRFSNNSKKFYH